MDELTLSGHDIQKIVNAVALSKDTIGTTAKNKGWKFGEDFHMAYFQSIVHNILHLILSRVKDNLKKSNRQMATKTVFNETFPTMRGASYPDNDVLKIIEDFFTDVVMKTLITEKMKYDAEFFGLGGQTKCYRFSNEFTESVRKLLAVKVVFYTNGLLLVAQNSTLTDGDIKRYAEISGTTERLIEGITGAFGQVVTDRVQQKKAKSPSRRARSPRRRAGSPRLPRQPKNEEEQTKEVN
jgi:hypothetical protein